MQKEKADAIIKEYIQPVFGFALQKTRRVDEAEDLAGKILLKAYEILLVKEDILNIGGYIFKIAHNVWADYVKAQMRQEKAVEWNDVYLPAEEEHDILAKLSDSEDIRLLRREIAYLSRIQRQIVMMYYFEDCHLLQIANKLSLPLGTVKWHLFEAKKELRKGMDSMRTIGDLGLNPVQFTNMGHSGNPGSKGDTADFLAKRLTQNVAYAAYHKPLTIHEIADELGVSPVFVADEVAVLEEYGFMDKVGSNKYLTNIYITEMTAEHAEEQHTLFEKYAAQVGEQYSSQLLTMKSVFDETGVYYPDRDYNTLLWSVLPFAMDQKLSFPENRTVSHDELSVPRKDGGNYIAFANINKIHQPLSFASKFYNVCGDMRRQAEIYKLDAWQLDTFWCQREGGWRDNLTSDFISLYKFKEGLLPETEIHLDEYRRLVDKQYLTKENGIYSLNVVWLDSKAACDAFMQALPEATDEIRRLARSFDDEMYALELKGKPAQVHKIARSWSENMMASGAFRAYVLKYLLDTGLLKEPCEKHRKGIGTIVQVYR